MEDVSEYDGKVGRLVYFQVRVWGASYTFNDLTDDLETALDGLDVGFDPVTVNLTPPADAPTSV